MQVSHSIITFAHRDHIILGTQGLLLVKHWDQRVQVPLEAWMSTFVTSLTLTYVLQIPKNKIQKPENRRPWAEVGCNTTEIH